MTATRALIIGALIGAVLYLLRDTATEPDGPWCTCDEIDPAAEVLDWSPSAYGEARWIPHTPRVEALLQNAGSN